MHMSCQLIVHVHVGNYKLHRCFNAHKHDDALEFIHGTCLHHGA